MRQSTSPRLFIICVCASITLLIAIAVGQQKTNPQTREHQEKATDSAAISAAKLQLPEEEFNFGFIPNNSRVSHVYKFLSVGEEPLKILRVKPG